MKYVEHHLTREHFFHAPHHWFFALLLSPLHAAELHYQKRYHLKFAHARKLFLFDSLLLLTIIGLGTMTLVWYFYDPTITEQIELTVTPLRPNAPQEEATRIKSGEEITWLVNYSNHSEQNLRHVRLLLHLPENFLITGTVPAQFVTSSGEFILNTLPRNGSGSVRVTGIFYGVPDEEEHVIAELLYEPDGRPVTETKLAALVTTLRESVLTAELTAPHKIAAKGSVGLTLTLQNTGSRPLTGLGLALRPPANQDIKIASTTAGKFTDRGWEVAQILPNESIILNLRLNTQLPNRQTTTSFQLAPYITPRGTAIAQTTLTRTLEIAHPQITAASAWNTNTASPGTNPVVVLTIANNGLEILNDVALALPLPAGLIDVSKWRSLNSGKITNQIYYVTGSENPRLRTLLPGTSVALPLVVPIRTFPDSNSTNATLSLTPQISARIAGMEGMTEISSALNPLPLGTALSLHAEARYYTAEGDQLGRGPLPPQIGKETKYALLLTLSNGTSEVENVELQANLPPGIVWTGKTSVSQGADVKFDAATRRISWKLNRFAAHANASLFMEVGFTPTESDRGQARNLLTNLTVQAHDTYIDAPVRAVGPLLDTRLKTDGLAQTHGVLVR